MFYPFVIQTILSFYEGNYIFVAINKEWKNIYILLFKKTETRIGYCSPQQIEYAIAIGYMLSNETIKSAAKFGNLDVLKYFFDKTKYELYRYASEYAALGGHLEVLKWLHANNCLWDAWTCEHAARGGYLEVLKWLRINDYSWDTWTCSNAAKSGHLNVLKWARENGCPWDEDTCAMAAQGGHLEIVKWARENGCPSQ